MGYLILKIVYRRLELLIKQIETGIKVEFHRHVNKTNENNGNAYILLAYAFSLYLKSNFSFLTDNI